jgi:uncharacterized protein YjiS (DUF1127 family)
MSATADSQFSFQLPKMSYIDAHWEEPNLQTATPGQSSVRQTGLAAWLSRQVAAFAAWRRDSEAAGELAMMSDRELLDIGVSRSDLSRVFDPMFNQDLRNRGGNA